MRGENGKDVVGIVLLGTVIPVFSIVGTNGNIVDNNETDGKIVDVGTGITGSTFVIKGLLKGMIPGGRIVGPTGKTLWVRFESGTGVIELIFRFVTGNPFGAGIGFTVEEPRSMSTECGGKRRISRKSILRLGEGE